MEFLNAWKSLYQIAITITLHSGMRPSSLQRDVRSDGQTRLAKLSLRKLTSNNFHRVPMIPRQNKGQKMNKNVKFWHNLKVKPRFLILLINLKTGEKHNEGWESGGKGAQKYGRRENVVGETGDSDPLSHPPPPHHTKICADQKFPGALPGAL